MIIWLEVKTWLETTAPTEIEVWLGMSGRLNYSHFCAILNGFIGLENGMI
jgi:hypothetical protein